MNPGFVKVSDEVFFASGPMITVGRDVVTDLQDQAHKNARRVARLCAHRHLDDIVHEMLIVHCRGGYVRPHKHQSESVSYHVIEGQLDIVMFDEHGEISNVIALGDYESGASFFWRLSESRYYGVLPRSECVTFHETLNGPFRADESTIMAHWAPEPRDPRAVESYLAKLRKRVDDFVGGLGDSRGK